MKTFRVLTFLLVSAITISANCQTLTIIDAADVDGYSLSATGVSPDGQWIIGDYSGSSASMYSQACLLNLKKWEEKKALYANGYRYGSFADVNNGGYACGWIIDDDGNTGIGNAAPWSTGNEDKHWAKGFVYYTQQSPVKAVGIYDINENNTILGSFSYRYSDYIDSTSVEPILWTCSDEQLIKMINLPTPAEMIKGLRSYQVIPLKISEDETTIIGYVYGNCYIPLKWTIENGQYECKALANNYIEPIFYSRDHVYTTPYKSFHPYCVSDNCEWIGGELYDTEGNLFTARYNVSTDHFDVLLSNNGAGSSIITDDGTMIWGYNISTSEHFYYTAKYWMPNSSEPLDIKDAFTVLKDYDDITVSGISSDGKTIVGTILGGSDGNRIFVLSDAMQNGIHSVNIEEKPDKKAIYDLNGKRVNDTTIPGIYIKNGKKVVIK